ncbi:putative RNA recognition motif [Paratrimastix pyriformis]|uniref:RNA recognition motif n=1 Tax=Paratrimastix pyriformis TaxID=342808 RepID=A0ABQ8UZQ8_9EUKA|nr:putative RNA recognition motif [Paratrimastix pyriformis]
MTYPFVAQALPYPLDPTGPLIPSPQLPQMPLQMPMQMPGYGVNPDEAVDSDIKCLFISGLPADVKQREIHNLMRPYPGYEGSTLKAVGQKIACFAMFTTREQAQCALDGLNGITFDAELNSVLRVDFSRRNSNGIKRTREPEESRTQGRPRVETIPVPSTAPPPLSCYPPYLPNQSAYATAPSALLPSPPIPPDLSSLDPASASQTILPASERYPPAPYQAYAGWGGAPSSSRSFPSAQQQQRAPSLPIATLFVYNLPVSANEVALREIFGKYPGLGRLSVNHKPNGACVAFIEFSSVDEATTAMRALSGTPFEPGTQPMQIDYAKKPFGSPPTHRPPQTTPQ